MAVTLLEGSAFISGAASGIGQQTAYSFAKYGITKLALADVNMAGLQETAAHVQEQWPQVEVLTLKMNVSSTEEVKAGFAQVVAKFGRLDVAVNNAGISTAMSQTHVVDETEWHGLIDVNVHGVFRCQKEELAIMLGQEDLGMRRGRGVIINLSSMYGVVGPQHPIPLTAYTTAKHAVIGMTKADAHSYSGKNIRINAICPGYIETPIVGDAKMQQVQGHPLHSHVQLTPLRRLGQPEEIADSIVFLASPLSSFVNGTGLVADGGFSSA